MKAILREGRAGGSLSRFREPGDGALATLLRRASIALAAVQLGVAEGAMRLAASYTSERVQFGRPLGSFQAVQHQLADCWIDVDAMRVTLWEALSRDADPDSTVADAERTALVASWWRTQAGLDVVHRVQHVHGGMGVDVDYPVHRYFLWGKQIASTLGGADFAAALDHGLKFELALRRAAIAGSLACMKAGAQPSIPFDRDVRKYLTNG